MENPTNITKVDDTTFTYSVPNTITVDVIALSQESQNNLAHISELQDTIDNLTHRNTTIATILALAPTGVTVPLVQS